MARTESELKKLKEEVEELNKKLSELSDEELNVVAGGVSGYPGVFIPCKSIEKVVIP